MRYNELNKFLEGLGPSPGSRGDFSIIEKEKFIRKIAADTVFCMRLKIRKSPLNLGFRGK